MKRRSAIKNMVLLTTGVTILPSFLTASEGATALTATRSREELLAEVADTIIPGTDTPGAKDLGVHIFVLRMINGCYDKNAQDRFMNGLTQLDEISKSRFNKPFISCPASQREQLLTEISNKNGYQGDVLYFFPLMKSLTLQGYLNSQYVMTNLVKYELVPARFNGYFPVSKGSK